MIMTEQDVIASVHGLTLGNLRLCVDRGWVRPALGPEGPAFSDIDIARLTFILHLQDDLAANEEAVPIVLSLLDQVHGLRHALRTIAHAVDAQDEAIRTAVRAAVREALEGQE